MPQERRQIKLSAKTLMDASQNVFGFYLSYKQQTYFEN
jgi:hypothetical protein